MIKIAAGVAAGGLLGFAIFRSPGKGYRAASIMAGGGVALGSTYERIASAYSSGKIQSTDMSSINKS